MLVSNEINMFTKGSINPSVFNWVVVGLLAITFIVFSKWIVNRYNVVFLKDLINAV